MPGGREARISRLFVELADTLVDDLDVVDFLLRLAEAFVELLDVDTAGLMLADPSGRLQLVASSPESARHLELYELQIDEGPCLDTFRSGEPVVNVHLDDARERWPRFVERAAQSGMLSTHALPLRLRRERIGAVNLFSARDQPLVQADLDLGQALADVATIGLLQQRALQDRTVLAEQLQRALDTRVLLEQAKGMLAERTGTSPAEAFTRLRAYARRSGARLDHLARQVVEGELIDVPDGSRETR